MSLQMIPVSFAILSTACLVMTLASRRNDAA
jgi:hypothetical protein